MRKPYPSEVQDRFIVRLPKGMRQQLANAAKTNNRSMNAELVFLLERAFGASAQPPDANPASKDDIVALTSELAKMRTLLERSAQPGPPLKRFSKK